MQSKPFTKTAVIKAAVFSLLIIIITCYEDEPLNFKEPGQRKDFDYMKWSKVKISAVHDICSLDSSQSEFSYYLPFVRYHDRWKELGKLDFTYTPSKLYGFAPLYGSLHEEGEADFVPLESTRNCLLIVYSAIRIVPIHMVAPISF